VDLGWTTRGDTSCGQGVVVVVRGNYVEGQVQWSGGGCGGGQGEVVEVGQL